MRMSDPIERIAFQVIESGRQSAIKIVTAESCTGGLIAAALTSIPGSSAVFERGFVTYSNDAKTDLLGVLPDRLNHFGAVSPEIADDMAAGALAYSPADFALSVTGIAGPQGGSEEKPVGLVFFGLSSRDGRRIHMECRLKGDRHEIRSQAAVEGLTFLLSVIEKDPTIF